MNDIIIIECNIVNGWESSFLINLTKVFNYINGMTSSLYVVIKKYINLIYPAFTNWLADPFKVSSIKFNIFKDFSLGFNFNRIVYI